MNNAIVIRRNKTYMWSQYPYLRREGTLRISTWRSSPLMHCLVYMAFSSKSKKWKLTILTMVLQVILVVCSQTDIGAPYDVPPPPHVFPVINCKFSLAIHNFKYLIFSSFPKYFKFLGTNRKELVYTVPCGQVPVVMSEYNSRVWYACVIL